MMMNTTTTRSRGGRRTSPCQLINFNLYTLLLFTLLACSRGQLEGEGTPLPEGQYPLQIGSVALAGEAGSGTPATENRAAQTRVAETADGRGSVFQNGDAINVCIGDHYDNAGTYRLTVDEGSGNVTGTTVVTPVYWPSTSPAIINAWYTTANESTPNTVMLDAQDRNGLAYVLQGTSGTAVTYNTPATLTFSHQLAKVRVNIRRTDAQKEVDQVEIYNYTQCSHAQGTVTVSSTNRGWIPLRHVDTDVWEANVVPGQIQTDGGAFIRLNGNTPATISGISELTAGSLHELTVSLTTRYDEGTVDPFTHTITLNAGASLTSDMIREALNGGGTLVINGNFSLFELTPWWDYTNTITSLTLNDVTDITNGGIFTYMTALTELDLPNVTNIEPSAFICPRLTSLKLTSQDNITFSGGLTPYIASQTTLTLNANKRSEVTGNQWEGITWKAIVFE